MKTLLLSLLLALLSFAQISNAGETISTTTDESIKILDYVVDVHQTYSKTADVHAKVIEVLAGDGMNPTRMVLILNSGLGDSKIFDLGIMMYSVKRIVFLSKDKLVINYIQDDFDNVDDMNPIQKNRSVTLQILRNKDGFLSDEIKLID